MANRYVPIESRFWSQVEKPSLDACWLWRGHSVANAKGYRYGRIRYDAKEWPAHRLSWAMFHGSIPKGLHVLHRCDVTLCVNPAHLFLGTNLDNIADRVAKKRSAMGMRNGQARLTDALVQKIRKQVLNGVSRREIGRRLGIADSTVGRAVKGDHWKHVP